MPSLCGLKRRHRLQVEEKSVSKISDVDIALESSKFAKNQILVNSGSAMLAQANTIPEMALRLLS